jgi:hypothetical protein
VTLALKEWHVVAEAISRGDQVITVRKGGIREKAFAVAGSSFWLYPNWEHQQAAEVKRAWHGELARSNRERPTDGHIPIRCKCTVEGAWEIADAAQLEGLDRWHLWTPVYAEARLKWRPTKPLTVLLLRAWSLIEPFRLEPNAAYGGCKSWIELQQEPPAADLIPALTDTAFTLRAEAIEELLGEPAVEVGA